MDRRLDGFGFLDFLLAAEGGAKDLGKVGGGDSCRCRGGFFGPLAAVPDQFHERRVVVVGIPRFESEGSALYLHREDYEQRIALNSILLQVEGESGEEYLSAEGRLVAVAGRFEAPDRRGSGLERGRLREIESIELWQGADYLSEPSQP